MRAVQNFLKICKHSLKVDPVLVFMTYCTFIRIMIITGIINELQSAFQNFINSRKLWHFVCMKHTRFFIKSSSAGCHLNCYHRPPEKIQFCCWCSTENLCFYFHLLSYFCGQFMNFST
jgi:hypothetical protein